MENFNTHRWFKKQYLEEGMSDEEIQAIRRFEELTDDDKLKLMKIQAMMDKEKLDQSKSSSLIGRMGDRSLKEDDLEKAKPEETIEPEQTEEGEEGEPVMIGLMARRV